MWRDDYNSKESGRTYPPRRRSDRKTQLTSRLQPPADNDRNKRQSVRSVVLRIDISLAREALPVRWREGRSKPS
jgi:hypothetical protein